MDIRALRSFGVDSRKYKALFSVDKEEMEPKISKLCDLISGRVRDGRSLNLQEWRAFHAVDLAMDMPFSQTTATLVRHILSKHYENPEQILADLRAYGIPEDELFLRVPAPNGGIALTLNPPVLFNIFVPLVRAIVGVRTANLFNERNTSPFTPFEPLKDTERDKVLCEIITDVQDTISTRMGYPAVLRQAIQQMLRYGVAIAFPLEEWYCEKQVETTDGFDADGKPTLKTVTVREGLRYTVPHPTFMFYDLKYPLTSLNTDTGIEFCGYWHVTSYAQILDNKLYWNRRKIFSGTNWFQSPLAGNLFKEIFPCTMKMPNPGFEPMSREDKSAWYNTSSDRDSAVFITEYYMKLVPKDWGMADYKYPVWHRFTLAGDDTVIWCEPCAYNPCWFMGYDYNENDGRTSSMALEAIPWGDFLGNLISQINLTSRQNLTNVIFYDTNLVDAADIRRMENLGENRYKSVQYIGYDSFKTRVQGLQASQAFSPVNLTKIPIQEMLALIPMVLSIMERVLQISAQESGAQATHQQSKFELQQTGGATSNRVVYLGSAVDEGIDAWKRQRYDASMNYMDASVSAQVSADIPDAHRMIEELGFTVQHTGKEKLLVHGKKSGLRIDEFARSSEGRLRANDKEAAQILMSVVGTIAGQPELAKSVGTRNLLTLLEFAALLGGAPRGWRLREAADADKEEEVAPNVLEAIKQAQQATLEAVQQKIGQPAAQEVGKLQQEIQQLQGALKQLEGIYKIAAQQQDKSALAAQQTQAKLQARAQETQAKTAIRQAEFTQEQRRAEEKHQLEMRQETEKARLKIEAEAQELELKAQKSQLDLRTAAAKSDAASKAKTS